MKIYDAARQAKEFLEKIVDLLPDDAADEYLSAWEGLHYALKDAGELEKHDEPLILSAITKSTSE